MDIEVGGEGWDAAREHGRSVSNVDVLPCKVGSNAQAAVSTYFVVGSRDGHLSASLRGRRLLGRDWPIPPGYRGVVLSEGAAGRKPKDKDDNDNNKEEEQEDIENRRWWVVDGQFHSLRFWEHDSLPSKETKPMSALTWLSIAEKLHAHTVPSAAAPAAPQQGKRGRDEQERAQGGAEEDDCGAEPAAKRAREQLGDAEKKAHQEVGKEKGEGKAEEKEKEKEHGGAT